MVPYQFMAPAERVLQLKVLLSAEEKQMLQELADLDGLSIADVVRQLIRREHATRKPKKKR